MQHCAHLTVHSFIGIGTHTGLILPPPSPPATYPHVSLDTLLGLTIKAKWSKTVIGPFGFQLIGQGNDSGMIVPHLCIPPNSALVPLVIIFGGSKPMFAASTVQIDVDGSALGTACNVFPVIPVGLNQACNDPCNYPSDIVICPNSIVVGLTLADLLSGLVLIVIDVAVSAAASWLGGKIGDKIVGGILGRVWKAEAQALARAIGSEADGIVKAFVENALERPLGKAASTLIEKLFGVVVDPLAGWVSEQADTGIHNALPPPETAPAIPAGSAGRTSPSRVEGGRGGGTTTDAITGTSGTLTGADGSDPRIHNAE